MPTLPELKFNHNWNGKLGCDHYTTIRLSNPTKYHPNARFQVCLKGKPLHVARVVQVRQIKPSQINDWIAYLDTGYDAQETRKIIQTMYKSLDLTLDWILLEKEKNGK